MSLDLSYLIDPLRRLGECIPGFQMNKLMDTINGKHDPLPSSGRLGEGVNYSFVQHGALW